MIEARVREYSQIRSDPHGLIVPAVTIDTPEIDDLIRRSIGHVGTSFHLLLQDEQTGTYIVEVDLQVIRFRIPLENPPEHFTDIMLLNGLALIPTNAGEGTVTEYIPVGPFDRELVA